MMRNLTHTVNRIARALQELLGLNRDPFLAPIALDNRIALDYLLAAQWNICVTVNTSCCCWINTSSQVLKLETRKLSKHARTLKGYSNFVSRWFNLKFSDSFSWHPSSIGALLQSGLQIILLLIFIIGSVLMIFKLFMFYVSCWLETKTSMKI